MELLTNTPTAGVTGAKGSGKDMLETRYTKLSIVESKSKDGKIVLRGEFGWADKATENKRSYPSKLLMREFKRLNEAMAGRRMYGELDHPADARTSLHRVSHIVTNLQLTPNGIVVGEAEVLPTPAGKVLEALVRAGCNVGVSSRGYGSTKLTEDGIEEVQEDFQLVTYDVVADPAASSAYPKVYYEWVQRKESEMTVQEHKIAEAVQQATEKLKAEFASKMETLTAQLKSESVAQARSELLSDPTVAGAKVALDQIKAVAAPFLLGEDAQRVVTAKDTEIAELRAQLKAKDTEIAKVREENVALASVAKEAGYKYLMERILTGNPDADLIRRTVGDVKQYPTADALKQKMESVQSVIQRRRAQEDAVRVEEAAKAEALRKQLADKDAQIAALTEGLGKAVQLAKKQALATYAERRTPGSQREQARSVVENSGAQTKSEVDKLLESIPSDAPKYQGESTRARIKRLSGSGVEASALDEEAPRQPPAGRNSPDGGYNGLDAELNEIRELAGLN
jgi:hypothetical protein